jgi:hypothetical protein
MAMKSVTIDCDTDEILEWTKDNCKSFITSNRVVTSVTVTTNYRMTLPPVLKYSATYDFDDEYDAAFFLLRWS